MNASNDSRIFRIDKVSIGMANGDIIICASGSVNSSGWGSGHLSAWSYIDVPSDGIQDFDFVAEPPSGVVLWVLTPISTDLSAKKPAWLKGVRIHSASGSLEAMIGDEAAECEIRNVSSGDDLLPWPW